MRLLRGGLVLLCILIVAGLLAGSVSRPLSSSEAQHLMPTGNSPTTITAHIQAAWTTMVGSMERPARWLSVLAMGFGALILAWIAWRQSGTAGVLAALLVLCACPGFWDHGTGIATSAVFFLLTALVAMTCETAWSRSGKTIMITAVFATLLPWILSMEGGPEEFGRRVAGVTGLFGGYWGKTGAAGVAIGFLGVIVFLVFRMRPDGRRECIVVLLALLSLLLPAMAGRNAAVVGSVSTAFLFPLGLVVARLGKGRAPGLACVVLALLALPAGTNLLISITSPQRGPDYQHALDWVGRNVDHKSWMLLVGEDRALVRYYQGAGHRSGHRAFVIPEELTPHYAGNRAAFYKIPQIIIVGDPSGIIPHFQKRYVVDTSLKDTPHQVTILKYRT